MAKKKLTDLTGDGKVTQADVLKGRGVFAEGGDTQDNIIEQIKKIIKESKKPTEIIRTPEEIQKFLKQQEPKPDTSVLLKLDKETFKQLVKPMNRVQKEEGGDIDAQMEMMLGKEEEIPMEKTMSTDEDMEDGYLDFILDEALEDEEETYLMEQLENNDRLSLIFDKVIDVATEFAGSGPVNGPGSGVSDSIPARLSDGEFVFTAKATEEVGAENLEALMKEAEAEADGRQELNLGGKPTAEEETEVDQYGKPIDSNIVDDEIRKGMLSTNPRLK